VIPVLSIVPLKVWLIGGAVAAVVALGWYSKASYDEARREEGRAEVRAELLPVMRAQTQRLDEDRAAFDEVAKAMAIIKGRSQEIERGRAAARLLQQRRENQLAEDVADARAFVPTGDTELERLKSLIDQHLPGVTK
jgi:hypothetical protein